MAFPYGLAIGAGLVALAASMLSSSPTPTKKTTPSTPPPGARFTVRRGGAPLVEPLSAFAAGDFITVQIVDSQTRASTPIVLQVHSVEKDGLDASFDRVPIGSVEAASLPPTGTHFAVFPADVLVHISSSLISKKSAKLPEPTGGFGGVFGSDPAPFGGLHI